MQNDYLKGLNPAQLAAVQATDGPMMVIAGAGSGKTRVLTVRIAHLMASKGVDPFRILALTFTNKAAREMKERIAKIIGPDGSTEARNLWMGTFHSVFARVLRREAERIGFSRDFSIYDTDDTERLIRELMLRYGVDSKAVTPRAVRTRISGAKNQLVAPDEYLRLAADPFEQAVAKLYGPYDDALRKAKGLLRADKAGHTGTLDPLATGLLPIAFGAATKFAQIALDADKAYRATLRLAAIEMGWSPRGEPADPASIGGSMSRLGEERRA